MLRDGIYHSACHVGRGEGSKGILALKELFIPLMDREVETQLKASSFLVF